MNIEYLKKEIIPIRKKELKSMNGTQHPLYVVLDLQENYMSGHNEYDAMTNYKSKKQEHGYLWYPNTDDRVFRNKWPDEFGIEFEPVTRYWIDIFKAFFFTREAAERYLKQQSHNLSNEAYKYVFTPGYKNHQMENLLNDDV